MDDSFIKQYAIENGCSIKRARRRIEAAQKFMDVCEEELAANPFDRTYEDLTERDILCIRQRAAEQGVEWVPQEVQDAVELIRFARAKLRGETYD